MGRKCKCTICKKELDSDVAYVIERMVNPKDKNKEPTKKRFYFCNQKEYEAAEAEKEKIRNKKNRIYNIINFIMGYECKNTIMFQYEQNLAKEENSDIILEIHQNELRETLKWRGFSADTPEYNVIKYLSAVINNKYYDWNNQYKRQLLSPVNTTTPTELMLESTGHRKRKRTCLDDYED